MQKGFAPLLVIVIIIAVGAVAYFGFIHKNCQELGQPALYYPPGTTKPGPIYRCETLWGKILRQNPQISPSSTVAPSLTYTAQARFPTPISQNRVYENQFMRVALANGWIAKQANKTVYYGNCDNKENCTTSPKVEPNPVAVNITNGNYILYINTQASQASGVEGGRFNEIASGAPSVSAVHLDPSINGPCNTSTETTPVSPKNPRMDLSSQRIDLYIRGGMSEISINCRKPNIGSTVWYFSYVAGSDGGYFNYYGKGGAIGLVITMAYNSKDVNNLPTKDSSSLKQALNEMTTIVNSLVIK